MNYEEKVSTRADVRALYEKVINNPDIEKYRGYTETKSYAWDALAGEYIKRDGVVWFENPSYREELPLDEEIEEIEDAVEEELEEMGILSDTEEMSVSDEEDTERMICQLAAERDEARNALLELRDALALVVRLATAK